MSARFTLYISPLSFRRPSLFPLSLLLSAPAIHRRMRLCVDTAGAMQRSSPTSSQSSVSSWSAASSAGSQDSEDGEWLYQIACVETFMQLAADVTPADENPGASPEQPVATINYPPNFRFVYGIYRALRGQLEYTQMLPARGERCRVGAPPPVIHAIRTSAARWFLLLAFALRQCTSNYTVWKDRRDVLMSPAVLEQATRDALPELPVPAVILSCTASEADKQEALREMGEKQTRLRLTSQHWLPARADIAWEGRLSSWRAVRWELTAVGCFTRLYHKNFQVWHHRKELLMYALQQSPSHVRCGADAAATGANLEQQVEDSSPFVPLLASEATFSDYLRRHDGLDFAAVDERPTLRAVLCNEDGKNYHAWLHLSWYLHAFSFLLTPPSLRALDEHAMVVTAAAADQGLCFTPLPDWITTSESAAPPALRPTLPPSPLTEELQFTAQLIYEDCRNNSAWCHRFALFREALLRPLWRQLCSEACTNSDGAPTNSENWSGTLRAICAVELNYSLQWLYVDPTNEAAYTHARSVALLFHTLIARRHVWAAEHASTDGSKKLQRYLADAPLLTPVALANSEMCADVDAGTVRPSTPLVDLLRDRQRRVRWDTYVESFALMRHMQRVLHTAIRLRVTELEAQAARTLRLAAASNTRSSSGQAPKSEAIAALKTLYERSSQYMLDNFHQVDTAQYLACQAMLEEMWLTYMDAAQRRRVQQLRPSEAYREGLQPEWLEPCPWDERKTSATDAGKPEDCQDAVVLDFLAYEAAALSKAKQLTVADAIRLTYWKHEVLNIMYRGYGVSV
ncbi:protein farnesyltransferase alpha subunit,putative [Leishmania mexicana MHOM/GT/2001/U1103]|uniref:Protein farnesyltransferase/geranylgeranyltransferase type-1 subunit alpha n=1 Tax=Leishmania mexicana (strain MHOM/GT/2001/U1103) TaxID=929439 RepID=E9ALM9_LEIMU|nr:protein farnesyltransferase alpha subunit,putative [Leishmania mexicana MHOM/GT/2001/U1103]CBZ23834.1 protein farnesyltransferase alpha subunit,putative [Leishmania mexicana MHOM/GT/2001/U1103]